jgi:DNA polymerase-3 subunit epsilon
MKLNLRKPLIFFDLETTGLNIMTDRIIEIAYLKVFPNGDEESRKMRINPEMPIPAESTEIHHITDDDVRNCPTFRQVAQMLANVFKGCDIAGYNSNNFDVPFLAEEFLRADADFDFANSRFIDVQVVFHKMEKRTLEAAYRFYCNAELTDAHSADSDTKATYEVLKAQLDRYPELQNDVEFLSKFTKYNRNVDYAGRIVFNDNGVEVFNFGKHKGKPVEQVLREEPAYYSWMMNGDFPLYTKKVLTSIRLRMRG